MLQAKVVGSSSLMAFGTLAIGVGSILFGLLMPSITTPGEGRATAWACS